MKVNQFQSSSSNRNFQTGYADTMRGIETYPAGGTDRSANIQEWKAQVLIAADKCQDKQYAAGVRAALETI